MFLCQATHSGAQVSKRTVPGWRAQWSGQGNCARQGRSLSEDAPWLSTEDKRETAQHRECIECVHYTTTKQKQKKKMKMKILKMSVVLLHVVHLAKMVLAMCIAHFSLPMDTLPEWLEQEFQDISQRLTGRLQLEDAGQWRELQLLLTLSCKVLDSPEILIIQCVVKEGCYY